jgi:hypothetical protein
MAALWSRAAILGACLPPEVCRALGAALEWTGTNPSRNFLTPGFTPLEYSFSSWRPEEFRVAAQLFMNRCAADRCVRTVELVRWLSARHLVEPDLPGDEECSTVTRFGAFFGITADVYGVTGVEVYVQSDVPADESWRELRPFLQPVFTGFGARSSGTTRRSYFTITEEVSVATLGGALTHDMPTEAAHEMLSAVHSATGDRADLPSGTVMVSASPDASIRSVELHASAFRLSLRTLPDHLPWLRSAQYVRWLTAMGGDTAKGTVVSLRFDENAGVGAAAYAVPTRTFSCSGFRMQ